ncbi:TlpA disulfide reductase family protein [Flavobacterium psychrotolerans]|uniref:Thioredoxin domain-containing protein n=1 Tax=Flavobacterium psychrotolerans TaxID=2169410 RepID=A0A2U1JJU7_9FLAO|nr:TlpA disulfide reductase family protein [Flavobacterium psychrotolerans]PWA05412.1 hypothetical protein DB895_07395 [Flavobacterium psychrotolerans]
MKLLNNIQKIILILSMFSFLIFLTGFDKNNNEGFILNGNIKGEYTGYIYLFYNNIKDSCLVKENKFHFKGKVPFPCAATLGTITGPLDDAVYIENVSITINITIRKNTINGVTEYDSVLNSVLGTKTALIQKDFEKYKLTYEKKIDWNEKLYKKLINILTKNPKNSYTGILLDQMSSDSILNKEQLKQIYKKLNLDYQNKYAIVNLRKKIFDEGNINTGGKITNFKLYDTKGVLIDTRNYRGAYLLIDFWASWCGPCRREFPELIRVYNKFKNKKFVIETKGFQILGVSIDDSKDKWLKAVQKDNLMWDNVNDKGGFLSKTAIKYGIMAVPNNFLVDGFGNVIAKNVSPQELEKILEGNLKK